jgi:hypothetical protein
MLREFESDDWAEKVMNLLVSLKDRKEILREQIYEARDKMKEFLRT